jgi:hypothetical protein
MRMVSIGGNESNIEKFHRKCAARARRTFGGLSAYVILDGHISTLAHQETAHLSVIIARGHV